MCDVTAEKTVSNKYGIRGNKSELKTQIDICIKEISNNQRKTNGKV